MYARSIYILYMSYTPCYCRHLTRWKAAAPAPTWDAQIAGSIGMPLSVAESAELRSANHICLGRECLGPERISEVGFSIALIPRSGRATSSISKGRPLQLSCLEALSVHRGLSGIRASHHSPASRRCIIGIYHINPFSQGRLAVQGLIKHGLDAPPASREASADAV